MITFALGGFGGAINAAYAMNAMIHNTAWIQGHFHLTVGTAVALSFMGVSYWMLPRLTGRALIWPRVATLQPYLWFVGMQCFSIPNHIAGLMGMPRRVYTGEFQGVAAAQAWVPLVNLSAVGGVILFVSAMCYVGVLVGTMLVSPRGATRADRVRRIAGATDAGPVDLGSLRPVDGGRGGPHHPGLRPAALSPPHDGAIPVARLLALLSNQPWLTNHRPLPILHAPRR